MIIFAIHLPRATDRRAFLEEQATRLGLEMEYQRALDGKTGDFTAVNYCYQSAMKLFGRGLSANEAACAMSHFQAWQRIARQSEPVLVIEDDCQLTKEASWLEQIIRDVPENFDFIHAQRNDGWPVLLQGTFGRFTRCLKVPFGSCALIISPKGAKELMLRALPIAEPVDVLLSRVAAELEAYILSDEEFIGVPADLPTLVNG
jgi:glycosyl transferase, family 25